MRSLFRRLTFVWDRRNPSHAYLLLDEPLANTIIYWFFGALLFVFVWVPVAVLLDRFGHSAGEYLLGRWLFEAPLGFIALVVGFMIVVLIFAATVMFLVTLLSLPVAFYRGFKSDAEIARLLSTPPQLPVQQRPDIEVVVRHVY